MDLEVTVRRELAGTEAVVLVLTGDLEIDGAPRLMEALSTLLEHADNRIVVDLSALAFCDSIGLSALVDAYKWCSRNGGWLRLAAPDKMLLRTLSVVGLLTEIPAYDTVESALVGGAEGRLAPQLGTV
jgi:anti-sigma B factor antagonist